MSECVVHMEMPRNCFNCDLRYECNAFYAPGKPKPFMKGCRIIGQLPEGHGRLVESNQVAKMIYRWIGYLDEDMIYRIKFALNRDVPTIVPAEAERSET